MIPLSLLYQLRIINHRFESMRMRIRRLRCGRCVNIRTEGDVNGESPSSQSASSPKISYFSAKISIVRSSLHSLAQASERVLTLPPADLDAEWILCCLVHVLRRDVHACCF
jgi:hypothetical protein